MKIVHLIPTGILTDGFAYQDNLLTKYHIKMGYEVTAITNEYIYNQGIIAKDTRMDYYNEDGVHVIRLKIKGDKPFNYKFKKYPGLYKTLEKEKPDFLFIHGPCFVDLKIIKKYLKRNKNVIAYLDNHCDKSNSGKGFISYNILHKIVWKHYAQLIEPYIKKFYGVMPSRVEWLQEVYGLPKEKCELLIMGADDELVQKYNNDESIREVRKKLSIGRDDIVIVTGGKIDLAKKQTLLLMRTINNIKNKKIKLCIFGSVVDELKDEFNKLCNNENIIYLGWISNQEAYKYMSIADLIVFPGRHSVYWEIAVALGKPMICKYWYGTTHIDIGNNVTFLYEDSADDINKTLLPIINNKSILEKMKRGANKQKKNDFLYSSIAKKSLDSIEKEEDNL